MKRRKKKNPAAGVTLQEDGRYKVRVTMTDPMTRRRRDAVETLPPGTTLGEAIDHRALLRRRLIDDRSPSTTTRDEKPLFEDFAKEWIERRRKRLAPTTMESVIAAVAWCLPVLGPLHLDEITVSDLELVRDELESADLARNTGSCYWSRIRQVVREALARSGFQGIDPFKVIDPPRCSGGKTTDKRALTLEEAVRLLSAVEAAMAKRPAMWIQQRRLEVEMLLWTGMRVGEVYALLWEDVDLERAEAHIRPQTEKTRRGRDVALTVHLVEALRVWRRDMVSSQHRGLSTGLVFPSPRYGRKRRSWGLNKVLERASALAEVEVDVRAHTMRRTLNRALLTAGVEGAVIRSQLGHSSEKMTLLYAGVRSQDRAAAVASVGPESGTLEEASE